MMCSDTKNNSCFLLLLRAMNSDPEIVCVAIRRAIQVGDCKDKVFQGTVESLLQAFLVAAAVQLPGAGIDAGIPGALGQADRQELGF